MKVQYLNIPNSSVYESPVLELGIYESQVIKCHEFAKILFSIYEIPVGKSGIYESHMPQYTKFQYLNLMKIYKIPVAQYTKVQQSDWIGLY